MCNCWYCTGRKTQSRATRTFNIDVLGKTTFAKGDNGSWASSSAGVSYGTDAATSTNRWEFTRLGGTGEPLGMIKSIQFVGKCVRSPNDVNGAGIALETCDVNDPRQKWRGSRQELIDGKGFYRFENWHLNQGGFTGACLVESGGQVVQGPCTDAPDRLWAVRNNTTKVFDSEINAWGF